jgi:hypothetical protein
MLLPDAAIRYVPFTAIEPTFSMKGEPGTGRSLPALSAAKAEISVVLPPAELAMYT